jgi:glycine oxidase
MEMTVVGAGVAGLTCAVALAEQGVRVQVLERASSLGSNCSWYAGGMLAPWCELERAEPLIAQLGMRGIEWWQARVPHMARTGTLVVAHGRDSGELARFARHTGQCRTLDTEGIASLEPDLAGRFRQGLFYADEAHLDPRLALQALAERLSSLGGSIRFGVEHTTQPSSSPWVDCRGLAARDALPSLRGVKGEMLLLRTREITLSRPVRVLHPRFPLYVVPRGDGVFMIGATSIESDDIQRITARSVMELLGTAYTLHPAFAEAEIVELGTHARPAFPHNNPQLLWRNGALCVNGLYRHGYLIAPALAEMAVQVLLHQRHFPEVMDEDSRERRAS